MTVRVRQDAYALPSGDMTLDWYRQAVALMQSRGLDDPTSWWWIGAVHGRPQPPQFPPAPAGASAFWDQCQHQTWFFLPWHRGYLAAFEATVAKAVEELGGPTDWALPYWNYSESLVTNPEARRLPPAFRSPNLSDGSPNALFAPRGADANGEFGLRSVDVSLDALTQSVFTPVSGVSAGFGGPSTGFSHFGMASGALENIPHNVLHGRIGGWMGNPNTAAFDPIFWLHHCNIDRLWEVWRDADPAHLNPADPDWLANVPFELHDEDGTPFSFTSAEMENTTTVLHGYQYDSVPPPAVVVAGGPTGGVTEMADLESPPELAGASEAPLPLRGDRTPAKVRIDTAGLDRMSEGLLAPSVKVYLRLEGVRGTGVPADYDVLIDLEGDGIEPIQVGVLSTFGVANASDPESDHGGVGITQVFDITASAERLNLTDGSASELNVSFHRVAQGPVTEMALPLVDGGDVPAEAASSVEIGRIGVYFE